MNSYKNRLEIVYFFWENLWLRKKSKIQKKLLIDNIDYEIFMV